MKLIQRLQLSFVLIVSVMLLGAPSCKDSVAEDTGGNQPPPMFTGPEPFYTTVGSMVQIEGAYPMLVSGYGVVAGLTEETGSREVPAQLRQRLANDMRRHGFGSARMGLGQYTPDRILDRLDTAVVRIDGFVPAFASRSTRFDVLVSALDGTQTTSLDGGTLLYTVELAPGGARLVDLGSFIRPVASANGSLYVNPFEDDVSKKTRLELSRRAVVLSGGAATVDRSIRLILNQPSWTRSRAIADRINERFRKSPRDRDDTAKAQNDSVIELNIPQPWQRDPQRLLSLISNLYVQRGSDFEAEKAAELGRLVTAQPKYASRVALAWETLGRTALPVIRRYYDHSKTPVAFAALQAGVHLGDERASEYLDALAKQSDPDVRRQAAELMVYLPDSLRAEAALRRLLSDKNNHVRIAAYEALAKHGDRRHIQSRTFYEMEGRLNFTLDVVETDRPLIYISQASLPKIVIFNGYTGFTGKSIAAVWDHRLMIKSTGSRNPAEVFYQPPGQIEGKTVSIAPALANLIVLLARDPDRHPDDPSFGLPYTRVVNAVHQLHRGGHFGDTPLVLEQSKLAALIADAQKTQDRGDGGRPQRPEFDFDDEPSAEPEVPESPDSQQQQP